MRPCVCVYDGECGFGEGGVAFLPLLHLPAGPCTAAASHPRPRRQSCELHFSQVADGKLCVFLRGGAGSSDPSPVALSHTLPPPNSSIPPALSSVFLCEAPLLAALRPNRGGKIGHTARHLSPPQRSEK